MLTDSGFTYDLSGNVVTIRRLATSEIADGQLIADQLIIRGFQQGTGRMLRDGLRSFPSAYLG